MAEPFAPPVERNASQEAPFDTTEHVASAGAADGAADNPWVPGYTDEGYPYWFNQLTGESSWTEPPEAAAAREMAEGGGVGQSAEAVAQNDASAPFATEGESGDAAELFGGVAPADGAPFEPSGIAKQDSASADAGAGTEPAADVPSHPWVAGYTDEGYPYWFNQQTGESSWYEPPEVAAAREAAEGAERAAANGVDEGESEAAVIDKTVAPDAPPTEAVMPAVTDSGAAAGSDLFGGSQPSTSLPASTPASPTASGAST